MGSIPIVSTTKRLVEQCFLERSGEFRGGPGTYVASVASVAAGKTATQPTAGSENAAKRMVVAHAEHPKRLTIDSNLVATA